MLCLIIIGVVLIAFTTSCSKSKSDNNANFSGTFYGALASGLYSEADTIVITNSSSSAIVMKTRTGRGSTYTINGTVNGSALNIASQSVYIPSSEATYTVSGSGNLTDNSNLVIHYAFVSTANATTNLTFTGIRK